MVYRSAAAGESTDGSRCATTTISLSSVASAFSTAAIEAARPTESGISSPGNSTEFFSGSNGSVRICIFHVRHPVSLLLLKMLRRAQPDSTSNDSSSIAFRHHHLLAVPNLAGDQLPRQRRLHFFLDRALQRPRAESRIVADFHQVFARRVGQHQFDMPLRQPRAQACQLDLDNLLQVASRSAGGR